jgi:hypothetical protein
MRAPSLEISKALPALPLFLAEAFRMKRGTSRCLRRTPVQQFYLDDSFLNAVKSLVSEMETKKQYLGFSLASVILDPSLCNLERSSDFFSKSIANPLLQAIANVCKKQDIESELSCAALRTLEVAVKMIYSYYDAKQHQAALELLKQIV